MRAKFCLRLLALRGPSPGTNVSRPCMWSYEHAPLTSTPTAAATSHSTRSYWRRSIGLGSSLCMGWMLRNSISVPNMPASLAALHVYASSQSGSFAHRATETATLRFTAVSGNSFFPRTLLPKSWATLSSTMSTLHFHTTSSSSSMLGYFSRNSLMRSSKSSSSSSCPWMRRLFQRSVASEMTSPSFRAVRREPTPPLDPTTTAAGRACMRKEMTLPRCGSAVMFVPPGTATWSLSCPKPSTAARNVPSRASFEEHTPTMGRSPVGTMNRFSPRRCEGL
mmetsp:Transcript_55482/g.117982  ORF Transcript_55482/g.117982 Transcript_55482/m.117982 type:complete len:279 (+) Transcript_55482:2026-2862(+)